MVWIACVGGQGERGAIRYSAVARAWTALEHGLRRKTLRILHALTLNNLYTNIPCGNIKESRKVSQALLDENVGPSLLGEDCRQFCPAECTTESG